MYSLKSIYHFILNNICFILLIGSLFTFKLLNPQDVYAYSCSCTCDCGTSPTSSNCGIKSAESAYCPAEGLTCGEVKSCGCDPSCSGTKTCTTVYDGSGILNCSGLPSGQNPVGRNDAHFEVQADPNNCTVSGWTCDPDKYSQPLSVEIYEGAKLISTVLADDNFESPVSCGGYSNHRFRVQLPSSYQDDVAHSFTAKVKGINSSGTVDSTSSLIKWWDGSDRPDNFTLTCKKPFTPPVCVGEDQTDTSISISPSTWTDPNQTITLTAQLSSTTANITSGEFSCQTSVSNFTPIPDSANTGLNAKSVTISYTGQIPKACYDFALTNNNKMLIAAYGQDQYGVNTSGTNPDSSVYNYNCHENFNVDNSTCNSSGIPSSVTLGSIFSGTLGLTNTGGSGAPNPSNWTSALGYKLGNASCDTGNGWTPGGWQGSVWVSSQPQMFCFTPSPGMRRELTSSQTISPGNPVSWNVSMLAPTDVATVGNTYKLYWRSLVESPKVGAWFGQKCEKDIDILPRGITISAVCLLADASNPSRISITWTHTADAKGGYVVYRKNAGSATYTSLSPVSYTGAVGSTVTYTDTTISLGQEYDYQVWVCGKSGECSRFVTKSNEVRSSCNATALTCTATSDQIEGTTGSTIFIHQGTVQGQSGSVSYNWTLDSSALEPGSLTGSNVSTKYSTSGSKKAILTVRDSLGRQATCDTTVTVIDGAVLTCKASSNPLSGDPNNTIFTHLSEVSGQIGAVTYSWTLDNSALESGVLTSSSVATKYSTGGSKKAILNIQDSSGKKASCDTTVTVNTVPNLTCNASSNPTSGNTGSDIFTHQGDAQGGIGTVRFNWLLDSSATGYSSLTSASVTTSYTTSGIKSAVLTVSDDGGRQATCDTAVTVGTICQKTQIKGNIRSRYDIEGLLVGTKPVIKDVNVVVKHDKTGQTYSLKTDSGGNYSTVLDLCEGDTYSITIPSQSISGYQFPPLTYLDRKLSYVNQTQVGGCATSSCDFQMYPLPKSSCRINDFVSISPSTFPFAATFKNAAVNGREQVYSLTLDFGDGSDTQTVSPPPSMDSVIATHTYNENKNYTIPLTANLHFSDASGTVYRSSPVVSNCNIGFVTPYIVAGYVRSNSSDGPGIEGITVLVDDTIKITPLITDNTGYFSTSINGGSSYSVSIQSNSYAGTDVCGAVIQIGGNYYMKPLLTTATDATQDKKMQYENQSQASGCGENCNFIFYQAPYSDTEETYSPPEQTYPLDVTFAFPDMVTGFSAAGYADVSETKYRRFTCSGSNPELLVEGNPNLPSETQVCHFDAAGLSLYMTRRIIGEYNFNNCHSELIGGNYPDAWWQVGIGNVFSNYGGGTERAIQSIVPSGESLIESGGSATWNEGGIDYNADQGGDFGDYALEAQAGTYVKKDTYNYAFWQDKLADYTTYGKSKADVANIASWPNGIYEIEADQFPLVIGSTSGVTNLGSRQIAILYRGRVDILGDIITDKGGIFVLISGNQDSTGGQKGNIYISDGVAQLDGFYIADEYITTSSYKDDVDANRLLIRGGLIGWRGVNLWRHMQGADNQTPAEKFEHNADMIYTLKTTESDLKAFKIYQYVWSEVNH